MTLINKSQLINVSSSIYIVYFCLCILKILIVNTKETSPKLPICRTIKHVFRTLLRKNIEFRTMKTVEIPITWHTLDRGPETITSKALIVIINNKISLHNLQIHPLFSALIKLTVNVYDKTIFMKPILIYRFITIAIFLLFNEWTKDFSIFSFA